MSQTQPQQRKKKMSKKKKRQQRNRMILMAAIFALCVTGVAFILWPKGGDPGTTDKVTPTPGQEKQNPGDPTPTGTEAVPTGEPGEEEIDWKSMPLTGLAFEEAMSSNSKYAPLNGKYYDWIDLINISSSPINLSDYWISDSKDNPQKYQLPNVTLGAGERYTLYCNGVGEGNQAPFKISSSGEKIYLSNADGFCDRIKMPGDLPADSSFGRKDGEWLYFDNPTPGSAPGEGYAARTSVPAANYTSGIYNEPLMITLFGEGTIYYTTDGSKPTTASKVYAGDIPVTDVTTIRTFAVKDGRESEMAAYTYVIGKTHELPVLVVNGPYETTLGPKGVVELNKKGSGIEAEVMMTLIENGEEKFSVPCGISLSGNNGGSRDADKRNFNVKFRSSYGASKLKYKVFDDLDIDSFDSLRLKGGGEDWEFAIIRDEFMTHMTIGNTALCAQASKPVVLYLSGEYWGIYFIRERFSEDYVASHYDVSTESVDLLQGYTESVEAGTKDDYVALYTYVKNHDLSVQDNYDYVASRIDLDSLFDWYICRSYMGDKDPGGNIRYFRSSEGDNKWRWMFFDLDWGFYHEKDDPLTWQLESTNVKNRNTVIMLRKIIQSPNGKDAFLKRYAHLMDTFLNEEYITKEIDHWKSIIESEIPADRQRWGKTVSGWNSQIEKLYNYVKDGKRDKNVLRDIKSYFKLSDSQMKEYFGDKYNP